jgi:hypothetical protein
MRRRETLPLVYTHALWSSHLCFTQLLAVASAKVLTLSNSLAIV